MNLHEYQAKQLLAKHGVPVPNGLPCHRRQELAAVAARLGGDCWVAKCQIHAGGRGKAGGVKLVRSLAELQAFANQWLGGRLVTHQTSAEGQPVDTLLIERCSLISRELYLALVLDRAAGRVVVIASAAGGMDIETLAAEKPEQICRLELDPLCGPQPYQVRAIGFKLGLTANQLKQFQSLFMTLCELFVQYDLSLLEINPLVITSDGHLLCLDAKFTVDDNALYRQPLLLSMQDGAQQEARELEARQWDLNYVALEGEIGCMVNGAGLAMGTMDMIQLQGGRPANFLDVGGGATQERVAAAFKLILADPQVKVVLVNIFGGIVRCDLIAEGVMAAVAEVGITLPVVVRLEGNQAEGGRHALAHSGLNILAARSLSEAATLAVAAAKEQA